MPMGLELFVLGLSNANKQNFELAKKENSAIYLEIINEATFMPPIISFFPNRHRHEPLCKRRVF